MSIKKQEEKLFVEWANKRPGFVKDGVVNEESYSSSQPKVMLVLKEVNDTTDGGNWDLREFIEAGARYQTWNMVTRWLFGIRNLNKEIGWEEIETIIQEQRKDLLKSICVMNLKKSPGGTTTNNEELSRIAEEDKEYLNKQFCLYDSDLVICCGSIVSELFHNKVDFHKKPEWKMTRRGIWFHEYKPDKYVISYLHPQAHVPGYMLFYGLTDAVKEIYIKII